MRQLLAKDIDRPTQRIYHRIRDGEISDRELYRAYVHNLEYVLGEVVRLVRRLDCPVVITGDHGEHLGENGKYLHEADSTLIRQVPWFVVSETETGQREIESEFREMNAVSTDQDRSTAEIKDRLASLGYVE
jgi:glucan phosphoethanolaminetransferase (alkaline phosphatase superfamily)